MGAQRRWLLGELLAPAFLGTLLQPQTNEAGLALDPQPPREPKLVAAGPPLPPRPPVPTELNRSERASRAGGVIQQLRHWDPNGTFRWGQVGLIKHSPQALDGFSCCQRTILGIDPGCQGKRTGKTAEKEVFSGGAAGSGRLRSYRQGSGFWSGCADHVPE